MNHYQSIDILPYWNFQQIRKTDDVRYLCELDSYLELSKATKSKGIEESYQSILEEYNDKVLKRNTVSFYFEIDKEIQEYESERLVIQLALFLVETTYNREGFEDELKKAVDTLDDYGYSIDFEQSLKPQLKYIIGRNDSLINDIDDLQIEQNKKQNRSISDEEFHQELEKYRGMSIDIKKVSVAQYLAYENDFIKYIQDASNKTKSGNRQ